MVDFYTTSVQIIVTLILALTLQNLRPTKNITRLNRALRIYSDSMVFIWGSLGLTVCLLHLGDFTSISQNDGKIFVAASIIVLLIYLLLAIILPVNKYTLFILATLSMILPIFIGNLIYGIKLSSLDMILLGTIPWPAIVGFIILMNRSDFKEFTKELLGIGGHR